MVGCAALPGQMDDLIEHLERFGRPRVALVGDFMLDRSFFGDAERLSPDAPVPVLNVVRSENSSGGAGNVARSILALGGDVACVGLIGADWSGQELVKILSAGGAATDSLVPLADRQTTVKTRYVGLAQHRHAQHMLRVDSETAEPINAAQQRKLLEAVGNELPNCRVLAVQDHDKGLLTDEGTPELIASARRVDVPVIVDPALIDSYTRYRGATLLAPNRYETAHASGVEITDAASLARAAERLLEATDAQAVIVTLDREGAYLHTCSGHGQRIVHPHPRSVYDVSGAGDQVLATIALAVAEGCEPAEAAALANVAGGLAVEQVGFVPITRREMLDELDRMKGLLGGKVTDRSALARMIGRRRQRGETVVFTNGCFDLLHAGHVRYLRQARQLGSCLVVGVNSDRSARKLKGPTRPIIGQDERAEMLSSLECVDYVTIFDEDTPEALLELLQPDILAKGGSTPVIVGRRMVESHGGKVVRLDEVKDLSTTRIIDRITQAHNNAGGR